MRRLLARFLPPVARRQAGFTLVEMLVVLTIMGIVLAALIGAWVSGLHAETDATRRYQAQQNARLAVDKMRDELHCADALTLNSAASVSVHLPADCPDAKGTATTITYDTYCPQANTCLLRRNGVTVAEHITTGDAFSYTAPNATSLGKLRVTLPVDVTPADSIGSWDLAVDIVLRNTVRA